MTYISKPLVRKFRIL